MYSAEDASSSNLPVPLALWMDELLVVFSANSSHLGSHSGMCCGHCSVALVESLDKLLGCQYAELFQDC